MFSYGYFHSNQHSNPPAQSYSDFRTSHDVTFGSFEAVTRIFFPCYHPSSVTTISSLLGFGRGWLTNLHHVPQSCIIWNSYEAGNLLNYFHRYSLTLGVCTLRTLTSPRQWGEFLQLRYAKWKYSLAQKYGTKSVDFRQIKACRDEADWKSQILCKDSEKTINHGRWNVKYWKRWCRRFLC